MSDIKEQLSPTSVAPLGEPKKTTSEVSRPKRGRPKKVEKRPIGRPKGEGTIMKEYRQRMLNSPRSKKVIDSIFQAALDEEHKHQAAAWKIIVDRILPVSGFEKEAGAIRSNAIQVNITTVGGQVDVTGAPENGHASATDEPLEGDYEVNDSGT